MVSTPLKNISQLGSLFPIHGKIKNVPNHQPELDFIEALGARRLSDFLSSDLQDQTQIDPIPMIQGLVVMNCPVDDYPLVI